MYDNNYSPALRDKHKFTLESSLVWTGQMQVEQMFDTFVKHCLLNTWK